MTNRQFFDAWNAAESVAAMAAVTGLCATTCTQKAARLRALGVPLKRFRDNPFAQKREKDELIAEFTRMKSEPIASSEPTKPARRRKSK